MSVGNTEEFASLPTGVDDEATDGVSDEETTEAEEATPEEEEEQTPEVEATKPPKGYVPQKQVDELRSSLDKQVATERRQRQAIEAQLKATLDQTERVEAQLLELKVKDMTDEEARIERRDYEVAKRERALEARETAAKMAEALNKKDEYASYLASQHGVPKDELLEAESPDEMKRLAEKIAKYYRQAAKQKRTEAGTDKLDSGPTGRSGPGSFQQMTTLYAQGRITTEQYAAARRKAGIEDG